MTNLRNVGPTNLAMAHALKIAISFEKICHIDRWRFYTERERYDVDYEKTFFSP